MSGVLEHVIDACRFGDSALSFRICASTGTSSCTSTQPPAFAAYRSIDTLAGYYVWKSCSHRRCCAGRCERADWTGLSGTCHSSSYCEVWQQHCFSCRRAYPSSWYASRSIDSRCTCLTSILETANPPSISTPVWASSSDYDASTPQPGVLLMVDLDVPRNNTRVQLLHWMAANVTLGPKVSNSSSTPLVIPNMPVPYLQPSPPVGDVPHSYNLVLFSQPANFSIPAQYSNLTNNRVPFNVSQFVSDVGLGSPLAGSYFQVQNLTGTATTTYPPARTPTPTGTGNGSAPTEFQGAAAQLMGERALWVGVSTALLAGFAAVAL